MIPSLKCIAVLLVALASLATPPAARAQVAEGQELISLPPTGNVHELTLNTQIATSVSFPSEITLVSGYGMVLDAAAAQELMDAEKMSGALSRDMAVQPVTIVHYAQATPDTLIMRAVRKGTPCYLTVRCSGSIFLFKLVSGEKANLAVVVADPAASKNAGVREVKPQDIVKTRTVFSSAELVGILSKARQREFLETVNPGIYEGWQQRRGVSLTAKHGDIVSTITEVQQWTQKDAIVLRARLDNPSKKMFRFKPVDVQVRVGDRSYNVQLADSNGEVPAGGVTQLDVVLQGNALGGKEHLSIQNDFRLEIAEDSTSGPPPNDLLPPPPPLLPTIEPQRSFSSAPPEVYYEGTGAIMPENPADRRAPLPNLYGSGK